ncbi:hypothetical protein [Roseivivax sediminis]|uniref:Uncharacterized protein n=1 Tax=Roseivivax sediminis TaxID=936889 RepID=A0A1I1UDJ4_9RHOB|nr:hypothetical protein [Roseivivax sediminis]SFD67678.1 hypothetical protein SAMN04515678_102238 [Roseivivax sediminis]
MNMIASSYERDRAWSDQFIPQIKHIVGAHLLQAAPDALDMRQATDLLMLDGKDLRIAARVRRPGYAERFPHQFTIRSGLPSGGETELAKIVNGHGDWMFYAHANEWGGLERWWLIDLRAFRAALIRHKAGDGAIKWGNKTNPDGSRFVWFDLRSFPKHPSIVVAASG